jgi:hypothetical protein
MSVATMRNLTSILRRHFPGVIACCAAVIVAVMSMWVAQETVVTVNVFAGWRQSVIVFGVGLGLGGLAAELTALAAASSPGETLVGSIIVALIFALPFYGVMILLGIAAKD